MVNVLGSIYSAKGWDQPGSLGASQGIALSVTRPTPTAPWTITNASAVPALGGWFQVLVGPDNLFKVYGGWGGTQSPFSAYTGSLLAVNGTRLQNFQWAAGLIGYAGKNWRFSAEYSRATSFFYYRRQLLPGPVLPQLAARVLAGRVRSFLTPCIMERRGRTVPALSSFWRPRRAMRFGRFACPHPDAPHPRGPVPEVETDEASSSRSSPQRSSPYPHSRSRRSRSESSTR